MSLLLKAGADINSKGPGEGTALMVAAALGHNEVVSAILAHHLLNIHAGVSYFETVSSQFDIFFLFRVVWVTQPCNVPL